MIKALKLFKFRSHADISLSFSTGMCAIVGPNGIGKTNILEAISCATLGRSFRVETSTRDLLQENETTSRILLGFEENGIPHRIQYTFGKQSKEIIFDNTTYKSFSPLLGVVPVGIVCPKDVILIEGMPQSRRKYLNQMLCQASSEYAFHLKRVADIIVHKNAALKTENYTALDPLDQMLVSSAAIIQKKRHELIQSLNTLLIPEKDALLNSNETVSLCYEPSIFQPSTSTRVKEIERHCSLFGPQRDNVKIKLNDKDAFLHASEGQKRTIVLAMRFAELKALQASTGKSPLLLIDDFGAHLDKTRSARLIERTRKIDQCILTAPHPPKGVDQLLDLEAYLLTSSHQ